MEIFLYVIFYPFLIELNWKQSSFPVIICWKKGKLMHYIKHRTEYFVFTRNLKTYLLFHSKLSINMKQCFSQALPQLKVTLNMHILRLGTFKFLFHDYILLPFNNNVRILSTHFLIWGQWFTLFYPLCFMNLKLRRMYELAAEELVTHIIH